jgi:hypothetical protein
MSAPPVAAGAEDIARAVEEAFAVGIDPLTAANSRQ